LGVGGGFRGAECGGAGDAASVCGDVRLG
jgi:hypothetical protein